MECWNRHLYQNSLSELPPDLFQGLSSLTDLYVARQGGSQFILLGAPLTLFMLLLIGFDRAFIPPCLLDRSLQDNPLWCPLPIICESTSIEDVQCPYECIKCGDGFSCLNGTCIPESGTCQCEPGFATRECSFPCCSGHGELSWHLRAIQSFKRTQPAILT